MAGMMGISDLNLGDLPPTENEDDFMTEEEEAAELEAELKAKEKAENKKKKPKKALPGEEPTGDKKKKKKKKVGAGDPRYSIH